MRQLRTLAHPPTVPTMRMAKPITNEIKTTQTPVDTTRPPTVQRPQHTPGTTTTTQTQTTTHHRRMAMTMQRPCLTCQRLTTSTRCPQCATKHETLRAARRPPRPHYTGNYQTRSRKLRAQWTADPFTRCWLCGGLAKPGDPWQADHVYPGEIDSPLAPAHRSCNAARGNRNV